MLLQRYDGSNYGLRGSEIPITVQPIEPSALRTTTLGVQILPDPNHYFTGTITLILMSSVESRS